MNISKIFPITAQQSPMTKFAVIFIILFSITFQFLEPNPGIGIVKVPLMAISCCLLFFVNFSFSRAVVVGTIYLLYQFAVAYFMPNAVRMSTLLFSVGLVLTYCNFYNMVYVKQVFTIDLFIRIMKWLMMAYFIFCVLQQACLIVGIRYFPPVNLYYFLDRGIGTGSLSMEPSSFARTMLVCYYAYVKCCEYKRGLGPFTLRELFSGEHKWVTIRFLWMMCTMGSGTAFVCLILFSLYFVTRRNWWYIVPLLLICYSALQIIDYEPLNRATAVIDATQTLDAEQVTKTDGSAAVRLVPLLNSLNVDLFSSETWFGHGIDTSPDWRSTTLFYDYGLLFYILKLIFNFTCAYRFFSLATLFMFAGVGGGAGGNIWYAWDLMMIITCVRYFYDVYHK